MSTTAQNIEHLQAFFQDHIDALFLVDADNRRVLDANPFTTLQVVLEPADSPDTAAVRRQLRPARLETLVAACQESPTYLDKFYALQPGSPNGAKRLVLLLPAALRPHLGAEWLDSVSACATVVWRGAAERVSEEMEAHEFAWAGR